MLRIAVTVLVVAPLLGCRSETSAPSAAAPEDVDDAARRVLLKDLPDDEASARARQDAERFPRIVAGTTRLFAQLRAQRTLFDRAADVPLSADERALALGLFADVLDHAFALDALARLHLGLWKQHPLPTRTTSAQHFDLGFVAYLEQLSLAMELIEQTINKPQFEKLFDEGSVEHGVPAGAYARLKWNVVHVEDVVKALAAHQIVKLLQPVNDELRRDRVWTFVFERIEERDAVVKDRLTRRCVKLFAGNSVDIALDLAHAAWFPVQAETAEWMGDTRVRRAHSMLVSLDQVRAAVAKTEPGDIIVERRNWYLSNIGLPVFWPHAALWVGSPAELAAWADDLAIQKSFGTSFPKYLENRHTHA